MPTSQSESAISSNTPTQSALKGEESYQVNASDLSELGIDLTESAETTTQTKPTSGAKDSKADVKLGNEKIDVDLEADDEEDTSTIDQLLAGDSEVESEPEETPKVAEPEYIELDRFGVKTKLAKPKVIEYAQKGFDYETKMGEHKKREDTFDGKMKEFETYREEWEKKHSKVLQENDQYNYFFDHLKSTNPELFEQVDNEANQFIRQTRNPYFEKALTSLQKQNEELLSKIQNKDVEELRHNYYKELEDLKGMHQQKYARFGINLDEDAIKQEWLTNGGSLKKIYGKLYGDKLLAIAESRSLAAKKAVKNDNVPTVGKIKSSKTSTNMTDKLKRMNYSQIADMISNGGA